MQRRMFSVSSLFKPSAAIDLVCGSIHLQILHPRFLDIISCWFSSWLLFLFIIIIIFFLLHLRYLLHYICVVSHGTQREWKGKKFNTIIFCIKLFFPYCVLLFLVFICLTHNSFMFQYTVNRRIIWPYRFIAYIRSSHWSWIEVI